MMPCAPNLKANRPIWSDGETETFKATGRLTDAKFWSDENPALYDVYCLLTVDGKVVDAQKIRTGFRQAEFKGGAGTGGVYLNGKFVWLTGYAQRSSGRLGRSRPGVSGLDARLQRGIGPQHPRQLYPLDAHRAPAGGCPRLRPGRHR